MIFEIHPCINPEWVVIKPIDCIDECDFLDMMEAAFPQNFGNAYNLCDFMVVHHGGYENAIAFHANRGSY